MKNTKYLGDIRRTVVLDSNMPVVIGNSKITADQSLLNFISSACWRAAEYCREHDAAVLADNYQSLADALYDTLKQHGFYD